MRRFTRERRRPSPGPHSDCFEINIRVSISAIKAGRAGPYLVISFARQRGAINKRKQNDVKRARRRAGDYRLKDVQLTAEVRN